MHIYTVLNNSNILDHPWVANFLTKKAALDYVKELNREYWARSEAPKKPLPKPEKHWNGLRYDFTGGYCEEYVYIFNTETGE